MLNKIPLNVCRLMQYLLVEAPLKLSRSDREKVVCFSAIYMYSPFAAKLSAGVLAAMYSTSIEEVFFQMGAVTTMVGGIPERDISAMNRGEFPMTQHDIEMLAVAFAHLTDNYERKCDLEVEEINDIAFLTAFTKTLHSYFTMAKLEEPDNDECIRAGQLVMKAGYA